MNKNNPWELTPEELIDIESEWMTKYIDDCEKQVVPDLMRTVEQKSHERLLTFIKSNGKTLDDLEATVNNLYEKFGLK
jgi:hypothetical protein